MQPVHCAVEFCCIPQHAVTKLCALLCCAVPCCDVLRPLLQARAALQQHIEDHGVLGLPHEAVRAAFGLPPSSSLMSQSRGEAIKAATPKYTTTQVREYRVWMLV
jgi:hypothetical protein